MSNFTGIKKIFIYLVLLIIFFILIFYIYKIFKTYFEITSIEKNNLETKNILINSQKIYYVQNINKSKKKYLIIFVHGSPGDWSASKRFLLDNELIKYADLIAVDRLGFGKSGNKKLSYSLSEQSYYIYQIIKNFKNKKVILVGHSLGGSVVTKIAMDYTKEIFAIVSVAGAFDPKLEKLKWYNKIPDFIIIQNFLNDDLITSNIEMKNLKKELELMNYKYSKLSKIYFTLIQGLSDNLVEPRNIDFIKEKINSKKLKIIELENEGHFIYWTRFELIKDEIIKLLN